MAGFGDVIKLVSQILRTSSGEVASRGLPKVTTTGIRAGQPAVPGVTQSMRAVKAVRPVRAIEAVRPMRAIEAARPMRAIEAALPMRAIEAALPMRVIEAARPMRAIEAGPVRPRVNITEALTSQPAGGYTLDEALPPVRPGGSGSVGETVIPKERLAIESAPVEDAATEAVRRATLGSMLRSPVTAGVLTAGGFVPAVAETAGVELPDPVRQALLLGGAAGGLSGAFKGVRKFGKGGLKNRIVGGGLAAGAGIGALSSLLALSSPGVGAAVAELPTAVVPGQVPTFGPQDGGTGTPVEEAVSQMAMIDAAYEQALTQLMAQYGSLENMVMSAQAGDPVLNQQLAQIDAQYTAAQQAVSDSYSAAVGNIEGYATQADTLMREIAAQQAADYAAASGGMETMTAPAGVTGASGALAGASQTAVGGGGITGAALSRAAGGAASAQGAAARLALGTDLTGAAAATRAEQASMLAGLGGQRASAEQQVRIASAQREAEARAAQQQNLASIRQAQAEATYNLALSRAQQLASMSPQDYAAAQGGGSQKYPEWYGARIPGPAEAPANIDITVKGMDGKPVVGPATAGEVNRYLDVLDAALSTVVLDPQSAYGKLSEFYSSLDGNALNVYLNTGRPTTAGEAYTQLFGRAP